MADSADDEVRPMVACAATENRTAAPYYVMVCRTGQISMKFTIYPLFQLPNNISFTARKQRVRRDAGRTGPGET